MNPAEFIGFSRGRHSLDRSVWYNGLLMTFLATGEETQGQFALIEEVSRRGNVPPPQIHHREDEIFYVLQGEIVVAVGYRIIKGTPGTMIFLPRDVRHSFTIESEQLRILILLTPAGLEGWFKEFSVPAPAMTLPPADEPGYREVQRMLDAASQYGLEIWKVKGTTLERICHRERLSTVSILPRGPSDSDNSGPISSSSSSSSKLRGGFSRRVQKVG